MHYYKRNIGDYAKKAGRLTMLQHGAYTLLLDACYDRERFPTLDEAIEWTWASSTAEVEAVQFVLSRFFTLVDGVYIQARIKEELAEYEERSATNSRIARERETKRKEKSTNRARTVNDSPPADHESPPNHKPLTTNHISPTPSGEVEDSFSKFWACWPANERKQDKAKCLAKWRRDKLTQHLDAILRDVSAKKQTQKWRDGFVEAPLVYLTGKRWEDSATGATAVKKNSEQYAALHRDSSWWREAGFESVWDAMASRCWHDNADQFHEGKRTKEAA